MTLLGKIIRKNWLQHLVFWVLSVYAIGSYFSISNFLKFIDFFYAILFHIPLFVLVYVNLKLLIPRHLQKGQTFLYGLMCVFLLGFVYFLHDLTFEVLLPLLPTEFYMVSFTDDQVLITIFMIYLIITTLIKLSKSWYRVQELKGENLRLELETLKNQLNPHFLFNSLNSVYGLSLKKSDQAPKMILKLSDMLRFMLYEAKDDKVSLEQEIHFIESYLDLQRTRTNSSHSIDFKKDGKFDHYEIAPLLFINIIENAFKHGASTEVEESFINISIKLKNGVLTFTCVNSIGNAQPLEKNLGGIGLENVRKRLELIYANKSELMIQQTENKFEVVVKVHLS